MNKIDEILTRGVENIIPGQRQLRELLESHKKLNIYFGIDPTATKIHIGHAVALRKLQPLAELGHNVTFLVGDFTALIGDTSDKDSDRPVLTYEQIQENFKTYKKQAEKIVDFSKVKVAFNSKWLKKLNFTDVIKLSQNFSTGDFVGRELIKKRLNDGKKVGLHELLYPVMQGYDSMILDTDIQIGGTDQTFNMQAGRTLLWNIKHKESFVLALGFLEGTDGRKMSKSWGNAIWLDDDPSQMYGKVMSLRDELIPQYFELATNLDMNEIKIIQKEFINPMDLKKRLAYQIVSELHSTKLADIAQTSFKNTFQKGKTVDFPELKIPYTKLGLIDLLLETKMVGSKTDAKRLISQSAVEIDGKIINNQKEIITFPKTGIMVKVGKKRFAKVSQI